MTEKHSAGNAGLGDHDFPSRKERRRHEKEQIQARAQANVTRSVAPINPARYENIPKKTVSGKKAASGRGGNSNISPVPSSAKLKPAGKPAKSARKNSGKPVKKSMPLKKNSGVKKDRKPSNSRPGSGKNSKVTRPGKNPKRVGLWVKRILGVLSGLILVGIIAGCLTFLIAYYRLEVPEAQKFANAQVTTVYWGDNDTMMGKFAERNRTIVDTKSFKNSYIRDAVVASEDRTFYENSGIDVKGIARALWNNVRGRPTQGASTLTQQYVENYYTGKNTGYTGKFKETILALKINRQVPKEKIINDYLNTIYFGRGTYGIEAAANAYFGKSAKDMNLSESALLAGIIPAPNAWDPLVSPEQAKSRWNRVLNLMVADKMIKPEERKAATFPKVQEKKQEATYFKGTTGYLLQHVRQELITEIGYTEDEIDRAGIKVYTTIDPEKQKMLEDAVATLPEDRPQGLRVAASSIDTATGAVIAEYGGEDYQKIQRNAVTQDIAQAGSTFKPFALLAALEHGHKLNETINGSGPMKVGDTSIKNYGGASYGQVNLIQATKMSINTAYVRLNSEIGMDTTRQVAIAAGYPKDTAGLDQDALVGVLGSSSPHNIDIANAYTTFATGGIRRPAHIVAKITDSSGNVLYEADTTGTRQFEEENISELTKALAAVTESGGTGSTAGKLGRPVAAKTGSSNDNRSAQFVGYVPQMVTAVSMYQVGEDGSEQSITPFAGVREVTGGTLPAKIWLAYMKNAVKDLPAEPLFSYKSKGNRISPREKATPYQTAEVPSPPPPPTTSRPLIVTSQPPESPSPEESEQPEP
ncbi:transglycosylase domain-containing protein [Varibaculum prostatecancerukia]|uniref:transglycosylase domain-containing protein n=1 Tax=Varibaculum prostatecancerukia TaxID=2811781 RepID=UPI001C00682D|nr:transglycosylase domain-containing protein [Varibaculum prostatecancerukia]